MQRSFANAAQSEKKGLPLLYLLVCGVNLARITNKPLNDIIFSSLNGLMQRSFTKISNCIQIDSFALQYVHNTRPLLLVRIRDTHITHVMNNGLVVIRLLVHIDVVLLQQHYHHIQMSLFCCCNERSISTQINSVNINRTFQNIDSIGNFVFDCCCM